LRMSQLVRIALMSWIDGKNGVSMLEELIV
jgi:hypothetical protein